MITNQNSDKKRISLSIFIVVCVFIISLFAGKYHLSLKLMLSGDAYSIRVFLTLRLPRTVMALVGGFGLGITGFVFQTVFKNKLASPEIIGASSGASAGAAFAILFLPAGFVSVTLSAFAGSVIAVLMALVLASIVPGKKNLSIVLSGIAIHSLAQTIVMVLKLIADPEKELASIEYWIMGALNGVTLNKIYGAVIITLIGSVVIFLLYRQIVLLSVDDDEAALLGVSVTKMRVIILTVASLVVASIISVTGLISFVGLLAPHIARLITKDNRKETLFLSGVTGSGIMITADILARSISASELPVSVFTSLIGAPFLIFILMKRGDSND